MVWRWWPHWACAERQIHLFPKEDALRRPTVRISYYFLGTGAAPGRPAAVFDPRFDHNTADHQVRPWIFPSTSPLMLTAIPFFLTSPPPRWSRKIPACLIPCPTQVLRVRSHSPRIRLHSLWVRMYLPGIRSNSLPPALYPTPEPIQSYWEAGKEHWVEHIARQKLGRNSVDIARPFYRGRSLYSLQDPRLVLQHWQA